MMKILISLALLLLLVLGALMAGAGPAAHASLWDCPDVNDDGVVSILDLSKIASKFGEDRFGGREDVNGDEVVSILDLSRTASRFGASCRW